MEGEGRGGEGRGGDGGFVLKPGAWGGAGGGAGWCPAAAFRGGASSLALTGSAVGATASQREARSPAPIPTLISTPFPIPFFLPFPPFFLLHVSLPLFPAPTSFLCPLFSAPLPLPRLLPELSHLGMFLPQIGLVLLLDQSGGSEVALGSLYIPMHFSLPRPGWEEGSPPGVAASCSKQSHPRDGPDNGCAELLPDGSFHLNFVGRSKKPKPPISP